MANPIKYNVSSETRALNTGNFWIGTGDTAKGPTSTTGYYVGPNVPSGGYVIYLYNDLQPGDLAYHKADNDSELISFTNKLAGTSFTTVNECFNYYQGQSNKTLFNRDYESIVTDELVFAIDAGFLPSYPKNNTSIFDISATSLEGTLSGSINYSTNSGGILSNTDGGIYFNQGTTSPDINSSEFSATITFKYNSSNTDDRNVLLSKEGCYELSVNNITGKCQYYITTEDQSIPYYPGKIYIPAGTTYVFNAFEDNTDLYVNGVYDSTITTAYQNFTKVLSRGDIITSNKPIGGIKNNNGLQPAFERWKGTQFMWRVKRPTNQIYIFSPDGEAVIDVLLNGAAFSSSVVIPQDSYFDWSQTTSQQVTVRSVNGLPVCITQDGSSDKFSVHPADTELYGWRSNTIFAYPLTSSTVIELTRSDIAAGTFSSTTLPSDTGSYTNSVNGSSAATQFSGPAQYVRSDDLFFIDTYADSDGSDQVSWVSKKAFASKFVCTDDAEYVAFLSDGVTDLEVYWFDKDGNQKDTLNSSGTAGKGKNDYVSGIWTGSSSAVTAPAGDFFITNKPAYAVYDQDSSSGDESILPGAYRMFSGGSDVTDGAWHQMTITKNGTTEKLYVDGSLVGTFEGTDGNVWTSDNRINIGGNGGIDEPGTNFSGDIGNVFIYNKELTATEVSQNYTALSERFGL